MIGRVEIFKMAADFGVTAEGGVLGLGTDLPNIFSQTFVCF